MYYIAAALLIVVAILIIRKVASCLVKTIVGVVLLAALAYIYYKYRPF